MSSLYNLEPQPTAKVLLETTSGDISLELFAKQTPRTCRNFLQLCLDGYYNGTIFHRLVPGFVLQGGDPSGTGEGGEAIYDGGVVEGEFHSRLRYNRRGLLGMANTGRKNDNGSQFFLTLGATPELQGRNSMFGRVEGDTIYNVMKMGEADLVEGEGNERPLYPTKITGATVLVNPFDEMGARVADSQPIASESKSVNQKSKKRRVGRAILSFGGEEEEEVHSQPAVKQRKLNPSLVTSSGQHQVDSAKALGQAPLEHSRQTEKAIRRRRSKSRTSSPPRRPESHAQMPLPDDEKPSRSPSSSSEPGHVTKPSSILERTNAQISEMKKSMKRTIHAPTSETRKKSALEQMIPETSIRGRKRRPGGGTESSGDTETLDVLNAFRDKLGKIAPANDLRTPIPDLAVGNGDESGIAKDDDDDEEAEVCDLHFIVNCQSCKSWDQFGDDRDDGIGDGDNWMAHSLNFEKDRLGKDLNWKKKNEEDLLVIDPREKAMSMKEELKAKKMARMSGNTGRAWDRDRDKSQKARMVK